jgi:ketosteroid isomerase-like protein
MTPEPSPAWGEEPRAGVPATERSQTLTELVTVLRRHRTAPLPTPTGEAIPATGKPVRVRACDIVTVQNGVITSLRFYFDQMEVLGQLGLLPETPA